MQILKRLIPITAAILLAVLGTGIVSAREVTARSEESPGDPKRGRDLFISKGCMRCHSVWKEDDKKGPNLASIGMGRNLYELAASMWSHWTQMNAVLEQQQLTRIPLGESELRDIIAYLYYLNYYAEPGDAKKGLEIFTSKGCARCHAIEPLQAERRPGRAVYEMTEFRGPIALAVAVWSHGGDMIQRMRDLGVSWPRFKDGEVAHLVAFIRSRTGARRVEWTLPGDYRRGRSLFASKSCAACHQTSGRGSSRGPDLVATGRIDSAASLVGELWNHYPLMTAAMSAQGVAYSRITEREMEDLFAFIYWIRAYGLEGNVKMGRRLYTDKQCASCHEKSPDGKSMAPVLIRAGATRSVYAFLSSIWNHGSQMESQLRERNLAWPTLSGDEMRNLISYLRAGS